MRADDNNTTVKNQLWLAVYNFWSFYSTILQKKIVQHPPPPPPTAIACLHGDKVTEKIRFLNKIKNVAC